jgi:hypothetical protein
MHVPNPTGNDGSGLPRPRLDHQGPCGWRTRCWRAACVADYGVYNSVEVLGDEVLAHCHGERVRKAAPGPWKLVI